MTSALSEFAPRLIYPVVLSGGSGTRLWPMSRSARPKQLLPMLTQYSLLQESVRRLAGGARFAEPIIIANAEHRFIIAEQMREISVTPNPIILEPTARNTGPAVAVAAVHLLARDPSAIMLVMPSDHVIEDVEGFLDAVERGAKAAATGRLVTFGVAADRPETGYGYIRRGDELDTGVYQVDAFVEKPDAERAKSYIEDGRYTWNSGIFLFQASSYLDEFRLADAMSVAAVQRSVERAVAESDFFWLDKPSFAEATNQSIDYAVMERTRLAAVVPIDIGWSDVGAWDALWDISDKVGDTGNVEIGDVVAIDCRNSYLRSDERLIAAIGIEDFVVVSTSDAVLVAPKSRAQDVKMLLDRLRGAKRREADDWPTVNRPWGTYRSIYCGDRVQVKLITVKPGGSLSLQMHFHRAEHWVVVKGTARVWRGDEQTLVTENQSTYISVGTVHRLENPGTIPLHLIEVQSGSYFGEDDIVRLEDIYGRH